MIRSYWTWSILTLLIVCSQGMGVIEKLWIRVRAVDEKVARILIICLGMGSGVW